MTKRTNWLACLESDIKDGSVVPGIITEFENLKGCFGFNTVSGYFYK